jgi:general secretion pathway protein J
MMHSHRNHASDDAGFTLMEALVAVTLMGIVLAALATITAQWLPNWNRGFARTQRNELVSTALDRLVADLGAAEYVTANRAAQGPLFDGAELGVTFIRTAFGPNTRPGLEIVRIGEVADGRQGTALVRSTAPFVPFGTGPVVTDQINFANPVVLLRTPYRVSFAYAGPDGILRPSWQGEGTLPSIIQLTVRDAATERALSVSTAALVHIDSPVERVCMTGGGCGDDQTPADEQGRDNQAIQKQRERGGS